MNPLLPLEHLILLLVPAVILGAVLAWRSTDGLKVATRGTVVLLRALAVALLAIPLLNFGYWIERPEVGREEWAVLVDRSASMATVDVESASRWVRGVEAVERLTAEAKKRGKDIGWWVFAKEVAPVEKAEMLEKEEPDGMETRIWESLQTVLGRYPPGDVRLAGVVLISDGRVTIDDRRLAEQVPVLAKSIRAPVHVLPLGDQVVVSDLEIRPARRQFTSFKGKESSVRLRVTGTGIAPTQVKVAVENEQGEKIFSPEIRLKDGETVDVRVPLTDLAPGYHRFLASVDLLPNEVREENNRTEFTVQVLDEAVKVLLVEGSPYWDTKFIAQLLEQQENYQLEVVYRLAEEKFFSLRTDGSAGTATEAAPVAVERAAFPASPEELEKFDLVIFGRSAEYFLNAERISFLREWVERGGSVIYARGRPISGEMPEFEALFPMSWEIPWQGPYRWRPTFAGEDVGLFGSDLPGRTDPIWNQLPPLQEAAYSTKLKPFAQVLVDGIASVGEKEQRIPILVSRRVGEGVVVAVNAQDLWRWDFIPEVEKSSELYRDFWLQLINWTVAFSEFLPGRDYALRMSHRTMEAGKPMRVRVLRRQSATADGSPEIVIRRGQEEVRRVIPVESTRQSNAWETVVTLDEKGGYTLGVEVNGKPVGIFETLTITVPPGERDDLSVDVDFLRRLAESTGGKILDGKNWDPVFEREEVVTTGQTGDAEWRSTWDVWVVLLGMVGCFSAEWVVRRRSGLI